MKIITTPIEMVAWFDATGKPHPIRLRYKGTGVKVQKVVRMTQEKLAGNRMKVFRCQSEVDGVIIMVFELKYELQTCK
ncbi:hypothetical protein [Desulfosporosinus shakirovi]|uniref:hypothetical protein n=1 Tax=Desulfosporosinus shakirovi TaxID=2885154 RepID=UPI001E3C63AE|nr:hypothetical protein [Desulfosporosinus sp. SRJS8]MCB8814899.1 hypothetical protein [Desulfosporosinus sp. SRJS8]